MAQECDIRCLPPSNRYWFDARKFPAFNLGSAVVPAFILPITISLIFGLSSLYLKREQSGNNSIKEFSDNKDQEDLVKDQGVHPADEENLSKPGKNDSDGIQRSKHHHLVQWVLFTYASTSMQPPIVRGDIPEDGLWLTCLTQTFIVVLAGIALDHKLLKHSMLLASGWTILYLRQYHLSGLGFSSSSIAASALGVVSISLAYTGTAVAEFPLATSISVLLIRTLDPHIPDSAWIRSFKFMKFQIWPWAIVACVLVIRSGLNWWHTNSKQEASISKRLRDWVRSLSMPSMSDIWPVLDLLGVLVVLFGSIAVVFLVGGFFMSCFGFNWLLLGYSARPPSIHGLGSTLGGLLSAFVYLIGLLKLADDRDKKQRMVMGRKSVLVFVTSVGWSAVVATALGGSCMMINASLLRPVVR